MLREYLGLANATGRCYVTLMYLSWSIWDREVVVIRPQEAAPVCIPLEAVSMKEEGAVTRRNTLKTGRRKVLFKLSD